jgi:uncharacterized protein
MKWFLLPLVWIFLSTNLVAKDVPILTGRVVDEAKVLGEPFLQTWESQLQSLEETTGVQVAILVIPSLEGEPIEDYSLLVASTWKLGQKGADNGVLILVATRDKKVRIEVGYGLEGTLTDVYCHRIIQNKMIPEFRNFRWEKGLESALSVLLPILKGSPAVDIPELSLWEEFVTFPGFVGEAEKEGVWVYFFGIPFVLMIFLFCFISIFHEQNKNIGMFLFLLFFVQWVPTVFYGFHAWIISNFLYIFSYAFVRKFEHRYLWISKVKNWASSIFSMSSGWSSSSSSGSFSSGSSGGGFRGGGGSFGGGGSSGSW